MMRLTLNDRTVINIEIAGIYVDDYPDFCDAYFYHATFEDDGSELTENELELLTRLHPDELNELAFNSLT